MSKLARWIRSTVAVTLCSLFVLQPLQACTFFFLKAKDGSVICGRSMEFADDLGSKLDMVPRGTEFESQTPEGAKATKWKCKYGFVAMSIHGRKLYTDGINEKGVNVGVLWFVDGVHPKVERGDQVIANYDLIAWILGNFGSVEEVKQALGTLKIIAAFNETLKMVLPLHWSVTDAAGNSIVIEHIDGKLVVSDNSRNGVMTNSPNLHFHLTNLRRYSNLNPQAKPIPEALKEAGWALGSGLRGLPGDFTSPSRFVRISAQKFFAPKTKKAKEAVNQALPLLNTVDLVAGVAMFPGRGAGSGSQLTPWITVSDLKNLHYYYRTHDNQNVFRVDLNKLNFGEGQPYRSIDIYGGNSFIDVTGKAAK